MILKSPVNMKKRVKTLENPFSEALLASPMHAKSMWTLNFAALFLESLKKGTTCDFHPSRSP